MALVNEWRQTQHMRNYQSEYDRIRNELSKSAIPFQTKEGLKQLTIELQQMGVQIYNIVSIYKFYLNIYIYIYIYICIMNTSVKCYNRKPTYDELIQEAVIYQTETIKQPNIIAT